MTLSPDSSPASSANLFDRYLDVQRRIGIERNPERLAQLAMREIAHLLGAERSTLFLFDWKNMELRASFAEGMPENRTLVVPLRMGIVGTAILRRELTNITNAYAHPYFNADVDSALGYQTDSLLVAPMLSSDGRVLGGVELLNKRSGRFDAEDEARIQASASRLAKWIEEDRVYPAGVEAEMLSLRNLTKCDRGTVFKLDPATTRLIALFVDTGAEGQMERPLSLNMKMGIAGMVAVTGESLRIDDVWLDPRFDRSVDQRTGYRTRSMLCLPLKSSSGETVGVVQAINKRDGVFSDEDAATLEAVASIVAIAVENANLFQEQELQFQSMIAGLAAAVDANDALAAGHTSRVSELTMKLGQHLGVTADDQEVLRVAALLHDCGMIGVDHQLLKKAGPLDADELVQMRQHTALTEEILGKIHFSRRYRKVPMIAAAHHEAMDGSGYPRGLKGSEIPFLTRVISVADVYEALIAARPWRPGMSTEAALEHIVSRSGKLFDPSVIKALQAVLAAGA
jgi:HD-GYP domain-containing protein (c-di-GMP phosphodiesterase class II)